MTTRAARAPAQRAQRGVRVEARVTIGPAHAQPFRRLLDLVRPGHGRGERREAPTRPALTILTKPVERIDAPVIVGPRRAHRVAADEVDVFRLVRVRLTKDWQRPEPAHCTTPLLS